MAGYAGNWLCEGAKNPARDRVGLCLDGHISFDTAFEPAGIAFLSALSAGNDPLEVAVAALAGGVALKRPVLPHRAHAAATVAVTEISAVFLPFDPPTPHHDGAVHLKSLHRCSTCCGRDCPE